MYFFALASDVTKRPDVFYESCISSIASGDKNALGMLYTNTKAAVYGFALSIVRNAQDAEDVLQDTFVNIYTSAQSYKKMGKPMAWILTITRNLALMKLRARKTIADSFEDDWNLSVADTSAVPGEDRLMLSMALRSVTPEESQIVMLHAVAGFKHREIAEVLELPLSTVLSKYNRALKKLRKALEVGSDHA
jgi:RNA polymerase sigma-70 factor (ECF subfamily)